MAKILEMSAAVTVSAPAKLGDNKKKEEKPSKKN